MSMRSVSSALIVLTNRSAYALACGQRGGILTILISESASTVSKAAVKLCGPVTDQEPVIGCPVAEIGDEVPGLLSGPRSVGVAGRAEDVDVAGVGLDPEEDVDPLQRDGAAAATRAMIMPHGCCADFWHPSGSRLSRRGANVTRVPPAWGRLGRGRGLSTTSRPDAGRLQCGFPDVFAEPGAGDVPVGGEGAAAAGARWRVGVFARGRRSARSARDRPVRCPAAAMTGRAGRPPTRPPSYGRARGHMTVC